MSRNLTSRALDLAHLAVSLLALETSVTTFPVCFTLPRFLLLWRARLSWS